MILAPALINDSSYLLLITGQELKIKNLLVLIEKTSIYSILQINTEIFI
jgi:hypothetical protein